MNNNYPFETNYNQDELKIKPYKKHPVLPKLFTASIIIALICGKLAACRTSKGEC